MIIFEKIISLSDFMDNREIEKEIEKNVNLCGLCIAPA
jgi:hypothetical protein